MNNVIIICEVIAIFSILLLCRKLFGKNGLIAWVGLATILANIITAKNVNIIGLSTAIGTVMFASTFLATDILAECYSVQDAKKAVRFGLFSNIILIVSTQIALLYTPSEFDYANDAMKTLFSLNLRISIASAMMYYVANMADIYVFSKIKKQTHGKKLWLRNNVATILCNCLENFGFIGLAFAGIYDIHTILTIAVSTSIIEALVAICDTPFLYAAKKLKYGDELTA
jgi:uncharacterized integral membrane protein (TIGR00697 family)